MPENKIFVIGNEEIVILLGLLGIEGLILEDPKKFLGEFDNLIKNKSITMIIIAVELPQDVVSYLIDYKLNNKIPFIFFIPDIFQPRVDDLDIIFMEIQKQIAKIIN